MCIFNSTKNEFRTSKAFQKNNIIIIIYYYIIVIIVNNIIIIIIIIIILLIYISLSLKLHEEPRKVPFLIILSDGCYTQFPVRILPPTSCMLAGVRLAVIGSDLHRGDETILNFATVC